MEWKEALREVRKFNGLSFKEGENKVSFRDEIIKEIRKLLLPSAGSVGLAEVQEKVTLPLAQPTYPAYAVGIEQQVILVINVLNLKSEDESPRAVVIYGVGGIGKTTLATAVVARLNLENYPKEYNYARVEMDEESAKNDLKSMQQQILIDAFPNYNSGRKINLRDCREGQHHLRQAFRCQGNKPVFIFIDNVLRKKDMEDLLPEDLESLPKRSRMLLTARNLSVTEDVCEERGLQLFRHPVDALPDDKAIEILCKDAAKRKLIKDNYMERILQICSGIPLVLKIVGSNLRKMEYKVEKCTQILESLKQGKKIRDQDLSERLIYSVYRQFEDFAQEAFLDICCFFNKRDKPEVEYIVGAEALGSLIDAALVNTFSRGIFGPIMYLSVHDVVRAKGRSMSKSTRIMDLQGLHEAAVDQRTAEAIRGVWLEHDEDVVEERQLNLMKNSLPILGLGDKISTNGGMLMNFKELRYLQIGAAKYFGLIFKEGVSMYKVGSFSLFGQSMTLTSMAQTSTAVAASSKSQKPPPTLEGDVIRSVEAPKEQQSAVLSAPKSLYEKNAVGIEKQEIDVINKLNLNSEDESPQAVVIYGVGGIGKTTLANAVVAQLNLEKYSYIRVEMDEESDKYDLRRMVRKAFECEGNKAFFLFIDNLLRREDMENLLPIDLESLPKRSRMVLTTRNLKETDFCEERGLKRIPHPMDTLPDDQAMEILCKDAANRELINDNDVKRILQNCGGIPLVLKIVGAYLRKMEYKVDKCTQILESLEKCTQRLEPLEQGNKIKEENLSECLIDSVYSQLEDFAQEAFLDVCCFFNKWDRRQVEYIVGAEALESLIDAGLVNTSVITDREMHREGIFMGEELLTVNDVVRSKGRSMSKSTRIMDLQEFGEAAFDQRMAEAVKAVWLGYGQHVSGRPRRTVKFNEGFIANSCLGR